VAEAADRDTRIGVRLRKSAVVKLAEAGCTDAEIGATTGQTRQMVERYTKGVDQKRLAASAIHKWEAGGSEGKTNTRGGNLQNFGPKLQNNAVDSRDENKKLRKMSCDHRGLTLGEAASERWLSG
jgi:hypothetical protein